MTNPKPKKPRTCKKCADSAYKAQALENKLRHVSDNFGILSVQNIELSRVNDELQKAVVELTKERDEWKHKHVRAVCYPPMIMPIPEEKSLKDMVHGNIVERDDAPDKPSLFQRIALRTLMFGPLTWMILSFVAAFIVCWFIAMATRGAP